jgi:putative acetyltransferase
MSAVGWYDAEALEVWAASGSQDGLRRKIDRTTAFVAAVGNRVIGWSNLDDADVDQLYVDPDFGGIGVARSLFETIEAVARAQGTLELTAVASLRSLPAFRQFGFTELRQDDRCYDGHLFRVADMIKSLALARS